MTLRLALNIAVCLPIVGDFIMLMLAQQMPDIANRTDSGAAGWVTAVGGWSAAGLLVFILRWLLLVYIPSKDKQFETLVLAFTDRNEKNERVRQTEAKSSLDVIVAQNERELERVHMSVKLIVATFQQESEASRKDLRQELSENTNAVVDFRRVLEEYMTGHARTGPGATKAV